MRLLITFLLAIAITAAASAQKMLRQHKRLPYFLTLDPEKLSQRLTQGLDSDTAKVVAIHSWIAYNIKYDVKKWRRFDYSRMPVKKILRRRKAICVGYSDLFTELCGYAGIKSVQVPGYTKNINVDINDNFYLDDHMWNAVQIDSKWKLVDATWDAGYIKYHKRTLVGHVVYAFTLGRVSIVKHKPHFKRYPIDAYCMRPGTFFKIDHLPLNPLWQITDSVITIEAFRNDSSYYFKKYDLDVPDIVNKYGPGSDRSDYVSSGLKERDKTDGISGHEFNYRNHYVIGNTWAIRAEEAAGDLEPGSTDTTAQLKICDTIIALADIGVAHYDTNVIMLRQQKDELSISNSNKKRKFLENNKKLVASTKNSLRKLRKGKRVSVNGSLFCIKYRSNNRSTYRSMNRDRSFSKAKPPKKPRPEEAQRIRNSIKTLDDSITGTRGTIIQHFDEMDSLYALMQQRLGMYSGGVEASRGFTELLYRIRMEYYDDNDYEVRRYADTLLVRKPINDSLLDFTNNQLMIAYTFAQLKRSKSLFASRFKLYKAKLRMAQKLKSVSEPDRTINEMHHAALDSLGKEVAEWNEQLSTWKARSRALKRYCKKQRKRTTKELRGLVRERQLEYMMFRVRGNYIRRWTGSLISVSNDSRRELRLRKKEAERQKQKLLKKEGITLPHP